MGTADAAERELVQGLIKLAAGFVHAARGNPLGVAKNLAGARDHLGAAVDAETAGGSIEVVELASIDVPLHRRHRAHPGPGRHGTGTCHSTTGDPPPSEGLMNDDATAVDRPADGRGRLHAGEEPAPILLDVREPNEYVDGRAVGATSPRSRPSAARSGSCRGTARSS